MPALSCAYTKGPLLTNRSHGVTQALQVAGHRAKVYRSGYNYGLRRGVAGCQDCRTLGGRVAGITQRPHYRPLGNYFH